MPHLISDLPQKKTDEKRLVIIDGNHLVHRAFHAIQAPLKTKSGEPTNAVFGFASMLLNILELEKPDYLVVTFDERAPTFRHEAHEEYKATRVKAPDELYAQIPRIREMLESLKVPLFSKEGYEADDLMGTLAKKSAGEGIAAFIVTGDRDVLQMVGPSIYVVFPHKGYREPRIYDSARVQEEYGVTPAQMIDYKALTGDTSDNIPGVNGIGPKRAAALLQQYKTLDGIYHHLEEIPPPLKEKLAAGRDKAYFAQKLSRLVLDVPCEWDKKAAEVTAFDFQALDRFFERVEMESLRKRLSKAIPKEWRTSRDQMSLF